MCSVVYLLQIEFLPIKLLCFTFTYQQSQPNICSHSQFISTKAVSSDRSDIMYVCTPIHIYQDAYLSSVSKWKNIALDVFLNVGNSLLTHPIINIVSTVVATCMLHISSVPNSSLKMTFVWQTGKWSNTYSNYAQELPLESFFLWPSVEARTFITIHQLQLHMTSHH
jgi:hypothetical protein